MDKREQARRSSIKRTRMRRRAKQSKSSMICITLLSLAIAGVLSVQMVSLYEKNQEYRSREAELQSRLEAEQLRQDELEEREEYITTKEYIACRKSGAVRVCSRCENSGGIREVHDSAVWTI